MLAWSRPPPKCASCFRCGVHIPMLQLFVSVVLGLLVLFSLGFLSALMARRSSGLSAASAQCWGVWVVGSLEIFLQAPWPRRHTSNKRTQPLEERSCLFFVGANQAYVPTLFMYTLPVWFPCSCFVFAPLSFLVPPFFLLSQPLPRGGEPPSPSPPSPPQLSPPLGTVVSSPRRHHPRRLTPDPRLPPPAPSFHSRLPVLQCTVTSAAESLPVTP